MKLLTKKSDYAIRALIELAAEGGLFISTRDISKRQRMPYQFLRGIMRELIREGIVESKEGAGGGVRLARDPAGINIPEILAVFQGEIELSDCMFRKKICWNREKCALRKEIKRIESIVSEEFGKLSIADLAKRTGYGRKGRPDSCD